MRSAILRLNLLSALALTMESAAKDCVNNCEQDEASIKSKEKVDKCITSFQAAIEKAQKLAKAMQEELTQAQEAAKKAENI